MGGGETPGTSPEDPPVQAVRRSKILQGHLECVGNIGARYVLPAKRMGSAMYNVGLFP